MSASTSASCGCDLKSFTRRGGRTAAQEHWFFSKATQTIPVSGMLL